MRASRSTKLGTGQKRQKPGTVRQRHEESPTKFTLFDGRIEILDGQTEQTTGRKMTARIISEGFGRKRAPKRPTCFLNPMTSTHTGNTNAARSCRSTLIHSRQKAEFWTSRL
jgi:hypothetical protein